jgi:hypothetical protein
VIKVLAQHGGDVTLKQKGGQTPAEYAKSLGCMGILEFLEGTKQTPWLSSLLMQCLPHCSNALMVCSMLLLHRTCSSAISCIAQALGHTQMREPCAGTKCSLLPCSLYFRRCSISCIWRNQLGNKEGRLGYGIAAATRSHLTAVSGTL